jgi:VanZ family protein
LVHLPLYRPVLHALRGALCILLAALAVLGDVTASLIVAVFLALSFAHLLRSDRRPAVFDVLFALAALAGAVGYAFDLFGEIVPYDELTHAFTTFSVSLAFYFLFYGGAVPERRAVALGTSVFTLGVTVGAYWEIFEWFFVGKYTLADTISDLLVDSAGALAAAFVALALRRSGDPRDSLT